MVKRLPIMWRTQVQSLGQEDLEKELATHSSILAWKIPWSEEPVGYSPWGCKESDATERLHFLSFCCEKHQPSVLVELIPTCEQCSAHSSQWFEEVS